MKLLKVAVSLALLTAFSVGCTSSTPANVTNNKDIAAVNIEADTAKVFDLGNNTGISVPVKISLNRKSNKFNIKQLTNGFGGLANVLAVRIRLTTTTQLANAGSASAAFAGTMGQLTTDGYVASFDITNGGLAVTSPTTFTLNNLKPGESYKLIAEAYSDLGFTTNETSLDGTSSNTNGGGTAESTEQIDVATDGVISIAADGGTANTVDIDIQLKAQAGATAGGEVEIFDGDPPAAETIS